MSDKPLHVQVAMALGWSQIEPGNRLNASDPGVGYPPANAIVGRKQEVPHYDTDWSATGPLIERYKIDLRVAVWADHSKTEWEASAWLPNHKPLEVKHAIGATPLAAVCRLVVALAAAGKLPKEGA